MFLSPHMAWGPFMHFYGSPGSIRAITMSVLDVVFNQWLVYCAWYIIGAQYINEWHFYANLQSVGENSPTKTGYWGWKERSDSWAFWHLESILLTSTFWSVSNVIKMEDEAWNCQCDMINKYNHRICWLWEPCPLGRMKCSNSTTSLPSSNYLFLKLQKINPTEKKNYNLNKKEIITVSNPV